MSKAAVSMGITLGAIAKSHKPLQGQYSHCYLSCDIDQRLRNSFPRQAYNKCMTLFHSVTSSYRVRLRHHDIARIIRIDRHAGEIERRQLRQVHGRNVTSSAVIITTPLRHRLHDTALATRERRCLRTRLRVDRQPSAKRAIWSSVRP